MKKGLDKMPTELQKEEKLSNPIEEYKQEIGKYKALWNSIEISTVIGRQNNGWTLLAMRVFFSNRRYPKEICDVLLKTPYICMVKEIKHIESIDELFNGLKSKSPKIADFNVRVDEFQFDWDRSRKNSSILETLIGWPIIWLRGYGKSVIELINEKETDKELNRLGYGRLYEESKDLLDFYVGGGYLTHIFLVAPVYIRINSGTLKGDKITVTVLTHKSVKLEDLKIVSPLMKGRTLPLNKVADREDFYEYYGELSGKSLDADSAIIRLYYKDEPEQIDIERISRAPEEIAPHNPRVAALSSLINETLLRKWLGLEGRITPTVKGEKGEKLEQYEITYMNLLSCAGFFVLNFGKGWDIKGIDLIAFPPNSKDIIAISCVRTSAIGEKIEEIKPICNLLRDSLKDYNIFPVICSPALPRDFTQENKDSCKVEEIGLIMASEMEKIFDMAMRGACLEIVNYIKAIIKGGY